MWATRDFTEDERNFATSVFLPASNTGEINSGSSVTMGCDVVCWNFDILAHYPRRKVRHVYNHINS
jgi:hypothetical protein